jgi:hypothetical protein
MGILDRVERTPFATFFPSITCSSRLDVCGFSNPKQNKLFLNEKLENNSKKNNCKNACHRYAPYCKVLKSFSNSWILGAFLKPSELITLHQH